MYRLLRVKSTGQWCQPVIVSDRLPDDPGYADRAAATLGLSAGSLEVVDADEDLRTGELMEDPNKPEPLPDPGPSRDEQLADAFDAIASDPALADTTKQAIRQAVTLLRGK